MCNLSGIKLEFYCIYHKITNKKKRKESSEFLLYSEEELRCLKVYTMILVLVDGVEIETVLARLQKFSILKQVHSSCV